MIGQLKTKPWRSTKYLAWVREQPCCHCRHPAPSEAHHMIGLGGGRMGSKAGDNLAMPLCRDCHSDLHEGRIEADAQVQWIVDAQQRAFSEGVLDVS